MAVLMKTKNKNQKYKNYSTQLITIQNYQKKIKIRPVILANIWVKPTTNCYRNEKCIFEIYNPICISEKKSSNVAWWEIYFFYMSQALKAAKNACYYW